VHKYDYSWHLIGNNNIKKCMESLNVLRAFDDHVSDLHT
jgi:hypothetical protein